MRDLTGLSILVTRPASQGKVLCEEIENAGGSTIHFPTIEYASIDFELNPIEDYHHYDWIIFISREAVLRTSALIKHFSTNTRIATVGAGTADTLQELGVNRVIYPSENWTSEGLLDLPEFKNITQEHILIIRGEGGRDVLAENLAARGAIVDHLPVYRRVVPVYANITLSLALLRQKKIDIIVCTSGESLHNLMTILGVENQTLLIELAIVVVSSRLVELAKNCGFQRVFQAKNASHDAVIDTLYFIKGKCHVR